MVSATARNFLCAIKLFGKNKPNELMGEYKLRKRPDEVRAGMYALIYTICTADYDNNPSRLHLRIGNSRR
jgi:hypothetical protein